MNVERWTWAGQEHHPGFCLTCVRDREPETVGALLGADSLSVRTLGDAERAYPITLPGALLRLGKFGNWAFCFEDRAPIATREPAIARLSQETRLLQVTKSGDGMVIVRDVVNGHTVEWFEPGSTVYIDGTLRPRVAALLPAYPGIVASLTVVGDEVGAALDRAILEGPLLTALSTLNEPAIRR